MKNDQNVHKIAILSTNHIPTWHFLIKRKTFHFILIDLESEKKRHYWLFYDFVLLDNYLWCTSSYFEIHWLVWILLCCRLYEYISRTLGWSNFVIWPLCPYTHSEWRIMAFLCRIQAEMELSTNNRYLKVLKKFDCRSGLCKSWCKVYFEDTIWMIFSYLNRFIGKAGLNQCQVFKNTVLS